ncbi:hypothetical protein ABT144_29140 [Streptomyces sp. NPDC002039]|uniref:hypothetical protein n=1 Tax=unclassified Streptomyces TaxID=2593676 RepID=UPI003331444C
MTRRFAAFLRRAGLRRIHFHDLQHSTGPLWLEHGIDLVVDRDDPPATAAVR